MQLPWIVFPVTVPFFASRRKNPYALPEASLPSSVAAASGESPT